MKINLNYEFKLKPIKVDGAFLKYTTKGLPNAASKRILKNLKLNPDVLRKDFSKFMALKLKAYRIDVPLGTILTGPTTKTCMVLDQFLRGEADPNENINASPEYECDNRTVYFGVFTTFDTLPGEDAAGVNLNTLGVPLKLLYSSQ